MVGVADAGGILLKGIITLIVIDAIAGIKGSKKSWLMKAVCLCFNVLLWVIVEKTANKWYAWGMILDIMEYCLYLVILKRQTFSSMFAVVMAANIINAFCGVVVAALFAVVFGGVTQADRYYPVVLVSGYLLRFLPLVLVLFLSRIYRVSQLLVKQRGRYIIIVIGLTFQFSRAIIHSMNQNVSNAQLYIAITILLMGFLLGVLWIIDWHCNEKEKQSLWEDNRKMSSVLTRSFINKLLA